MSIRPVEFNGMIQNTHEVSHTKVNEDNKANLQQQNIQMTVMKEEEKTATQVRDMEEAQQHEYNYGEGGKGDGYSGTKKRKKSNDKKQNKPDGAVLLKNARKSFDMKI